MWNKLFLAILTPLVLLGEVKAVIFSFGAKEPAANWDAIGAWVMHLMNLPKEKADALVEKREALLTLGGDEELFWEIYQSSLDAKVHPMWMPVPLPEQFHIEPLWASDFQEAFFDPMEYVPEMIGLVAALQNAGFATPLLSKQESNPFSILLSMGSHGPIIPLYAVEGYENMLNVLKISLSEAVLVDASPANVAAARSAGGDGIVFENPEQLKKELRQRGIQL